MPNENMSPEPGPQFDPMLDTERPASPWRMWAVALGVTAVVVLVLYGLTHHEDANTQTASTGPAASPAITTSAAPPANPSEQNKQSQQAQSEAKGDTPQTTGQGTNTPAPANSTKAQDRVNQPTRNNAPANAGSPGNNAAK